MEEREQSGLFGSESAKSVESADYSDERLFLKKPKRTRRTKPEQYPEGFAAWRAEWPPECWVKPDLAEKEWRKLNPSAELVQEMIAAIRYQRNSRQWEDPAYVPHPRTWLHQRRWEDPPEKYHLDPPGQRRYFQAMGMTAL